MSTFSTPDGFSGFYFVLGTAVLENKLFESADYSIEESACSFQLSGALSVFLQGRSESAGDPDVLLASVSLPSFYDLCTAQKNSAVHVGTTWSNLEQSNIAPSYGIVQGICDDRP